MVYHFIAIASQYLCGKRLAWHYASETKLDMSKIKKFMEKAAEQNSAQFGIHKLSTESASWKSVIEKDSFFEDIVVTENEDNFLSLLHEDKKLTALDIAKFILGILPMSQLKLQKLVYLIYAEYLVKYGAPLFQEDIVAYRYGPVVVELYQEFKKHGYDEISSIEEGPPFLIRDIAFPPLFMKIASADSGTDIFETILSVISNYGDMTANELVSLTHLPGSPWDQVFEEMMNRKITDESIIKYHKYETIEAKLED